MLSIITIISYLLAVFLQAFLLSGKLTSKTHRFLLGGVSACAVILHAVLLHQWIDIAAGQNLTVLNIFSFVTWLMALLIILAAIGLPVINLILFIFPLAAFSIILLNLFPHYAMIIDTAQQPRELWHILLSTLTFSVFVIAALQAILLAMQDRRLKNIHPGTHLNTLPPLEIIESVLFKIISFGFLLLTLLILLSLYDFRHMLLAVLSKIILALVVWIIFAVLLIGRYFWGWRSRKVIYGTLIAVFLLVIIYFGSQLFLGP